MFDVWIGDIELTTLVLIFCVVVFLPIQLLLCFKVKSKVLRLMPAVVLFALSIFFAVMSASSSGWDGIGWMFFFLYAASMLFMSGVAWGVFGIYKLLRK